MIVRDKPSLFKVFFILRGSIVPLILPQIILVALLGAVVSVIQSLWPHIFPSYTMAPLALLGVALSLFLGFRNNASYDRWWEARKQWGTLIVSSRNLARQSISYIEGESESGAQAQQQIIHLTIAFNHALRHRMRHTDPWPDIKKYVPLEEREALANVENLPDALLRAIANTLAQCRRQRLLTDYMLQTLDACLSSMAEVQAACERIQNTPLPFAYMLLVQRTAYLYCLILPFGVVSSLGLATPLFCAIIGYTFFGLDALSEELEEPFGLCANDLPLSAMTRTCEINLLEALGVEDLPEPLKPQNHRLE